MKIAFLHYHLRTCGVTTVLKGQVTAIRDSCELLVLTGEPPQGPWPCPVAVIPGLAYDAPGVEPPLAQAVAGQVLRALADRWPAGCDLLHIHNPTLAKNRRLLQIIKRLQQSGVNLFLQIHDFAEDGRPGMYFREPYPENCHYGVINGRDAGILLRSGLEPSGLHRIPNTVGRLAAQPGRGAPAYVLYPVRAIRRKNIGEALLLSLFLPEGQRLGVTLPPASPQDLPGYRAWQRFVEENRLPVEFDVGLRHAFAALVGEAPSMVTTSIAEGFGLSFLEPWTAGKSLRGRRIDPVCGDFERNGVCLDALYDRLDVPLDWLDAGAFSHRWRAAVFRSADAYGHRVEEADVNRGFAAMTGCRRIDFGMLDETAQQQVLSLLLSDPGAGRELAALNPRLVPSPAGADLTATVENNRRAVLRRYAAEPYAQQLLAIYAAVIGRPVRQRIDKLRLLKAFFDLERFTLLKWGLP